MDMSDGLRTSLIITTYNWPEALRVVLDSVLKQRKSPDEIIIADDGSREDTAETIKEVLGPTKFRWCHVRHEDNGIRQARIKNLAVRYSQGDYLVFIDHDVVLHPDFIKDHTSWAENRVFLQGKRCFLSERHTREALLKSDPFALPSPFAEGMENRKNAVHAPTIGKFLSRKKNFQKVLRGCNFSVSKGNFLLTDGFDETFDQLWGREDSDICYRLFHCGVNLRNLWFCATQYHLHHPVRKDAKRDRLDDELDRILKERRTRALKGFSTISSEGEIVVSSWHHKRGSTRKFSDDHALEPRY